MKLILITLLVSLTVVGCAQNSTSKTEKDDHSHDKKHKDDDHHHGGMHEMIENALAEEYEGIITSSGKEEGLFEISETGINMEAVTSAANDFIASLSTELKDELLYPIDDKEWQDWINVDNGMVQRSGVSIRMMDQNQRKKAFHLLQESLSLKGLQLSKDIMKTDHTGAELSKDTSAYGEDLYFFTLMGEPSPTEPWGWQLEGHHLIISYFVIGDQIVMSPVFMGAEPVVTTSGKYKGNTLFQDEQNLGLAFMQSLDEVQQKLAIISENKGGNDNQASAYRDNVTLDYEGVSGAALTTEQQEKLLGLIDAYVSNMRDEHAKVKMSEVKKHLKETHFAWIGKSDDSAVFYYRVHSPVVLIEFDHQSPGPLGDHSNGHAPSRDHIHTVVRTPNGNDYGKDLLKQHLEEHHTH